MELRFKLARKFQNHHKTLGNLKLYDGKEIVLMLRTVELPWLNNERRISCIPAGRYMAKVHHSPRFGWALWLQDVPGRSEILVHTANFVRQLLGCIAPGLYHTDIDYDGIIDVASSGDAMKIIETYMKGLRDIEIEITDPNPFMNWVERNEYIPNALKHLIK